MHTVDLLEDALGAAQPLNFKIRQEWFGVGTSGCEINGQRWLFVDLAQGPLDQLHGVLDTLKRENALSRITLSSELAQRLDYRKSA